MRHNRNVSRVMAGILVVGTLVSPMPSAAYAAANENSTALVTEQVVDVLDETGTEARVENAETKPVEKEEV